ncbi:MAG: hypothetical protein A2Z11_02940 [Candidatus Woykebacteria bacterium RBG_16_43_9]|uniref:Uncharacterized protein n=1 Tax=Candidatus Woykebacteria bacterium RBG_16_43_9 TaxID=1802596 RepID=A0A1G1WCE8_9BACT|nr:MAG: hypothetical protein A2Z11_02940 [Candidatus Woykebacteria bacterium RBG_16_43_9]
MPRPGKKRRKKRTRSRSGKRTRQLGRNSAGGSSLIGTVDKEVEEGSSVEVASSRQVSTSVPAVATLPPVETGHNGSDPWQSPKAFMGGIIGKLVSFVASIRSHSGDAAGDMLEGLDTVDGGLEDKVRAKLDHILEIRSQALEEEDLEKSERFGIAYARLGDCLRKLQTTDAN